MTQPGGGNNVNLAALWIPVMPETSHMGEEMRKAGQESKRQFEQGFNSGASPESMGSNFGSKLQQSISKEFKNFELPYGASGFLEKFNVEVDKSTEKLKGQASQALRTYRTEYDNLSVAQTRATEAENKLSVAREGGYNKASIMLPLLKEHTAAQTNLTEAHARAGAALDDYNGKVTQLGAAHESGSRSGQIMAGMMGGAIVAGANLAVSAIEHLVEGIAEGFTKAVELTTELAKAAVELGEKYEHIGIQIHEFSTSSGEDFAKMEEAAQHVFSTLDVAGNDVGKTMAQLSSIMGVSGEEISSLVRNVTELQGRFTTLKATDLGSTFRVFKVPAEEADRALASLLQSARGSGQDLGQLASALSGNVALTLHEAGMNIEQAGEFTANLMKMGEPGRQAMTGMAMAMKEFSKEGVSFSDGMKLAGQRLTELGDTAEGQDLAQKLFGARNWIVAKDAVQNYLDIINQAPDAFSATTASTQEFLDQTATLGNKIEEFKHKAEDAFKPFGEAAKNAAITGLNYISTWFSTHHTQIIGQIKSWGDKLIDLLPVVQEWGVDFIRIFGMVAQALALVMVPVATTIATAGAGMLALTGHFKEAGHMMEAVGKFDAAAFTGDIGLTINNFADKIQGIKIDTDAIKSNFDDAANSALSIPPTVGSGAGQPYSSATGPGPGSAAFPAPGPSGAPSAPGQWFPAPGAPAPGGAPSAPGAHHADWDAIAQKESSGRWTVPTPGPVPYGGGLQIKPDTWYEFGGLKYAQLPYEATKEQQIEIAERILNGWGSRPGQGPGAWANGATYVERKQRGGAPGRMVTSGAGSKDDVAALLTRGEYVWDTETTDKYGWLIKALHQGSVGFDQGGSTLNTKGAQVDTIAVAEAAQQLFGINDIGMFRSADGYNEHASGEAADVMVSDKSTGDRIAQYFLANAGQFGVQYVLWQQTQWNPDGTKSKMGDRGGPTQNHMDHVHVRTLGGGFPQGADQSGFAAPSSGATSNVPAPVVQGMAAMGGPGGAGSMPGGSSQFPGMPGQYGGLGVYGGETEDQRRQLEKAVQDANDRKADLDHQVIVNQRAVDDLKDQIGKVGVSTKLDVFGKPYPLTPDEQAKVGDKRKKLNEQLDDATHTLEVSQREAAQQTDNITDAQRKQQEGAYKKPSGATGSGQGKQAVTGEAAFSQLGSSLLGGIGQELGFGDVFSKPPWEWGAVKLLTGLAGWGIKTANNVADAIGTGKSGLTGFQPIPGYDSGSGGSGAGSLLSGFTGSLGIPSVSAGPNAVTTQPPGPFGPPTGPAPGPPVIQGDYMPINVQAGIDPRQVTGPMQEERNKQAAQAAGHTGGVPQ